MGTEFIKQSTARTILVGPILDTDGAPYTTDDLVYTDFKITKAGSETTLNASATVTHSHQGQFRLALQTADTDTLGGCVVSLNKADLAMAPKTLMVIGSAIFTTDVESTGLRTVNTTSIAGSGTGPTRLNQMLNTDWATFYDDTNKRIRAGVSGFIDTTLTETSAGYIAAAVKKFFDKATPTGTINSLPDAVAGAAGGLFIAGTNAATSVTTALTANIIGDVTGSLSGSVGALATAALQDVTQEIHGTSGTVWHVATAALGGDDGNDGLTWDTPKLSPVTVAAGATAGDVILLGPGTLACGDAVFEPPDGVSVYGCGSDATTVTSAATKTAKGSCFRPASNATARGFTIEGTVETDQAGVGSYDEAGTPQVEFTDAVLEDIVTRNVDTGLFVTQCDYTAWTQRQCNFRGKYVGVCIASSDATVHEVISYDSVAHATGGVAYPRGWVTIGAKSYVYGGKIFAESGTSTTTGIDATGSSVFEGMGVNIDSTETSGTALDVVQGGDATIRLTGCQYDRTKTTGTVTDIARVVTDTSGYVYLNTAWDAAKTASQHNAAAVVTALGTGSTLTDCLTATGFSTLDAAGIRTAVGMESANLDTQLTAIVGDTNELQADWTDGGRLDLILDATLADTAELQADWTDGGRLDLLLDSAVAGSSALTLSSEGTSLSSEEQ